MTQLISESNQYTQPPYNNTADHMSYPTETKKEFLVDWLLVLLQA